METWYVEWVDSLSVADRWVRPEGLSSEPAFGSCHTVGFLVREDDESVMLAQSYSLNGDGEVEEWGHVWGIPKVAITSKFRVPAVV